MTARSRHAAQCAGQACANDEDRDDLHVIRKRGRVLIRVRTVGVEETAAVGAQHLDGFLRGHRPLPDGLRLGGLFERMRNRIRAEVLRHALPDQEQRVKNARRRQNVKHRPSHVDPEIANRRGTGSLDTTDQRHGNHDACRSRPEVVRRQARHLREITHGRLGRVELPICIRGEAGGGVEGKIGAHRGQMLRVPGQVILQTLDGVSKHHGHGREAEESECVLAPVHLLVGLYGAKFVDEPLKGSKDRVQPGSLAFEHARHVDANRTHRDQQDDGVNGKLQPAVCGHVRTSPGTAVRR